MSSIPLATLFDTPWLPGCCSTCGPYLLTVLHHLPLWDLGASHLLPPPLHCPVQELLHLPLWEHGGAPQQLVFIFIDCGERLRVRSGSGHPQWGSRAGTSAPPNGSTNSRHQSSASPMDASQLQALGEKSGCGVQTANLRCEASGMNLPGGHRRLWRSCMYS